MTFTDMPATTRSRAVRVLALLLAGAGMWWWIESSRPEAPRSFLERAGGPARPAPTVPSGTVAGPGASPQPQKARHRAFRSPLEQSPGWVPPADPESVSVLTGRREAPLVTGEFEGGMPTLVSLVGAALDAARRGDEDALHALRATRGEFDRFLWREFPQSRPVTNITAADAWSFLSAGSLTGANRAVAAWGGRNLEIVKIESSGRLPFTNFTLWRDLVVTARDAETGEVHRISFLPAVVERHGRHKVFTYKD
jgi:hypothetical protein